MKLACAALVSATLLLPLASATAAQEVKLTSTDGSIELSGVLLDFDGEIFRIETGFGVLTVAAGAATCADAGCPDAGGFVAEWTISGPRPGVDRLVPALLEAFARQEGLGMSQQSKGSASTLFVLSAPDTGADVARVRVLEANADKSFTDLADGIVQMVVATREPDAGERARASEAGSGQLSDPGQSRLLALDAIVAVAHPAAASSAIAADELSGLLARPRDRPVHAARPLAGQVPGPLGLTLSETVIRHATARELAAAVGDDVSAIGLTLLSDAEGVRPLALRGTCGAELAAEQRNVKAEDYPLTVAHYLYLSRRRLPAVARGFVAFTASETAQGAVLASGFVDQTIENTSLSEQGDRLARAILSSGEEIGAGALRTMVGALSGAERLTPTFRFRDGSAELDGPSRANVALVAQGIAGGAFDDGTLLVVGFSDGQGGAAANLALSRERAAAVRVALEAAVPAAARGRVRFDDRGFGEALPIACDEDAWGRSVNRRVELWLRQR